MEVMKKETPILRRALFYFANWRGELPEEITNAVIKLYEEQRHESYVRSNKRKSLTRKMMIEENARLKERLNMLLGGG